MADQPTVAEVTDEMRLIAVEVKMARDEAAAARAEAHAALADVRAVRDELGLLLNWVRELKGLLNPPP
jgi:hypothetical protein